MADGQNRKPILTIEQQIMHLKQKGVSFELCAEAEAARIRRQAEQAVLDSVRLLKIDRELRPVSAIGNLNTPRK